MCSEKDERVFSALRSINHPQTVRVVGQNGPPVARLFCKNKFEYLMRKTRVTVGRTSAKSAADVDMGSSTYISRNHLEIYMTESRFYVLVTGKNGVFIDGVFHRKGSAPFELQRVALLRFPSTDITIQFHILLEEECATPVKCPPLAIAEDQVKKENNVSFKSANSPINKSQANEVPPSSLTVKSEVKQEPVVPMTLCSEEVVTKPRNKEPVVKELKALIVEDGGVRDNSKPAYSYAQLIVQAISSQKDKQLTLSGIYGYITKRYPYYRSGDKGWQNSIRHNLSLNRYFIKVPRAQEESGKGSFWKIDPNSEAQLTEQAFKRRRPRTTQGANKTNQGEATPSLASMSSVEADGIGTPEDSCLSWEGGAGIEESNEHVITEEVKRQPLVFPGNGATYEGQGNDMFEEPVHQLSVPFTHHTLPQLVTRPQFFITKPCGMSGALNHLPGVLPLQMPVTMSAAASNALVARSNDLEQRDLTGDNKMFMVPEKPAPIMSYIGRPTQMQSFHPKTVIVRMNSSNAGASPVGGPIVRLAFGVPTMEGRNILPAANIKSETEEMETDEMVNSVDTLNYSAYDSTDAMNGEMNCIQLQTISN